MSNTITAFFKGRIGVAEAVYQNDYGIIMIFDSIELPSHFTCYFSVIGEDEAIPGIGADRQVVIPNACLAKAGDVTLHIPLHTGPNDSEVEYVVYFKVIGRARPSDDGTPAQRATIERALAMLEAPLTNIEDIVNDALAFTGPTLKSLQEKDLAHESSISNLGEKTSRSEEAINALEARVDSFTHLEEGSTTGDAELIDGRVGADGVTYSNIGTANRTQFSNLKDDITILANEVNGTHRIDLVWEQGNLNASGEQSNSKVIRTVDYYSAADIASLTPRINGSYVATLVKYSGNTDPATEFIDYIPLADGVPVIPDGTYPYFRIKMQNSSSVEVVPAEGKNLIIRAKDNIYIEEIHKDAVGAMVEIAETYFNAAYDTSDQIVYQHQRGMYSENTETDEGIKAMPCSQFVTACFSATPYEYSRYVRDNNESYWWGLYTDGTGRYAYEDYMASPNMAQYCQDKGWLHTFNIDHNDMKPGDLAFFSSDSEISNIGHVAIVLAVGKNRYTFMEASANNTRLVDGEDVALICTTTAYTNKMPTFYAHIPVTPSEYRTLVVLKDETLYRKTSASSTVNIKTYPLFTNLEKGFYSFACNYSGDGYPYIKVTYADGQSKNYSRDEISTDKYSVTFYAQMPVKSIEVRCAGAGNHTVSNISLRKGFYLY